MKHTAKAVLGQISDIDIRLLQVFKAVVHCGGFSAAELELNIGISTISRHIKDLETRLGLTLCKRGRSGFSLTVPGHRVYEETRRLIGAFNDFRSGIDDIHARMGGQLQLAVFEKNAGNPQSQLHRAIADFSRQAPNVLLNLHIRPINEIERGVLEGSYQLGIVPDHRSSNIFSYTPLFHEDMQLYCGYGHSLFEKNNTRLSWKSLSQYALAGLAYHSPNMTVSQQARLVRRANAYDQEGVATFILSGGYIGFLPTHYAASFVDHGSLRAINPKRIHYRVNFFLITRHTPEPTRAADLFARCLRTAHGIDKSVDNA